MQKVTMTSLLYCGQASIFVTGAALIGFDFFIHTRPISEFEFVYIGVVGVLGCICGAVSALKTLNRKLKGGEQ